MHRMPLSSNHYNVILRLGSDAAYFGVKGTLYAFVNLAALPYYKNLGVSGKDYQANVEPICCDSAT
jgi:hypothetical protein